MLNSSGLRAVTDGRITFASADRCDQGATSTRSRLIRLRAFDHS